MKRWLTLIATVVVLLFVIGGIKAYAVKKMIDGFAAQGQPKFTVTTTKAALEAWTPSVPAVASLRAVRGADLSLDAAGIVDSIHFDSGETARAGEVLLQLRNQDDVAKLQSLKATVALAETNLKRDTAQLQAQAVSQAVVDTDTLTLANAKAQLAEQQAVVDKKTLRAPFAGELGIRAVDVGQYLPAGTKVVTLQSLDPIYADFTLPQQALAQLRTGQTVVATTDAFGDLTFEGKITALDPQVDTDTRNVRIRATLKNPDRKLLPGMYANLNVTAGEATRYLTLPQTAVSFNPYGETVYIVSHPADSKDSDALTAKQVFVTTGARRGDQVAILTGIKEGDEVVTSGQLKLHNDAPVLINNSVLPANDPSPTPQEH